MLGYELSDLDDMINGIDTAMYLIDHPDNEHIYNKLNRASDFLKGLWAEGYFD